ncbi:MAG: ABC transporter permease, partial [bacterium]
MDTLLRNVRVGLRNLRRAPGFTVAATLTLALGIGLSTTVFTVADALLLRRLPVRDQNALVTLWGEKRRGGLANYPLSLTDARDFVRQSRALQEVALFGYEGATAPFIRQNGGIARLHRALVSGNYFSVVGAQPVRGRALRPGDDVIDAPRVAVLTFDAWQRRFGGDPEILTRRIELYESGLSYEIVGVMPKGFDYPKGTEFWAPMLSSTTAANEQYVAADLIGRLKPGSSRASAADELTAFFRRDEAPRFQRDLNGSAQLLPDVILGDTRRALIVFAVAAGVILIITCVNVANLALVRGVGRVREMAVRSAIGADRGSLAAQLLTENALLAIAGGVLGVVVAANAVNAFVMLAPPGLPRLNEIELNATALAGAIGITVLAALLFALAPAIVVSRADLQDVLRSDTRLSGNRQSRLTTEALVAGQIALALLVLSGAGLLMRSYLRLERAGLSLDPSHVVIGELAFPSDQFNGAPQQLALLERLIARLDSTPGVVAASPAVALPFSGTRGWDGRLAADGQTRDQAESNPMVNMEVVSPGYFDTFRIPILRGRLIVETDRSGSPTAVVVSRSTAQYFWPGADPIGRRLRMGWQGQALEVVGEVPDTRYRELKDARSSIYFALGQSPFPFAPTMLAIRTSGAPAQLLGSIRRTVSETAPGLTLATAAPFDTFLEEPLAQPRLNALLLGVFAVAAVALAAIGLFGAMATMVRQRTRELGVRMALGATPGSLRGLVLRRGIVIAAAGAAVGVVGALAANRFLAAMLYDVSATDAATLAMGVALVLLIAAVASLLPAHWTTRIEAVVAIR